MTEEEFNILEAKRKVYDDTFCDTVQKFYHHPAVYHGLDSSENTRRLIYSIIFSDMTEKEIIAELDKIAPPGTTYM